MSGSNQVGGVVGQNFAASSYYSHDTISTVTSCYNTGSVFGNSQFGGVVGENYVTSDSVTAKVSNCYYLNTCVADSHNNNGTSLSDTQMKQQNSFVGFDFGTVWAMEGDADYPYPELQSFPIENDNLEGSEDNNESTNGNDSSDIADKDNVGYGDGCDEFDARPMIITAVIIAVVIIAL